jgi:bifunctional DNA-binding transcriptional regulator/antitoxin component of YhaV-PrlF toxin-antitoxin module
MEVKTVKESLINSKGAVTIPQEISDVLGGLKNGDVLAWIVLEEDDGTKRFLIVKRENQIELLRGKCPCCLTDELHKSRW